MLDLIGALWLAGGLGPVPALAEGAGLEAWLPSLRVGMWVKVEQRQGADGVLEAARIKLYGAELDEVTLESTVAAVDLPRLTIQTSVGVRVVATPQTELEGPRQQRHVGLALLAVGDRIKVAGQRQKDGTLIAEEIEIDEPDPPGGAGPLQPAYELTAPLEVVDASARRIVALGLPIQLLEDTRMRSSLPD